jgi:hypothetical protein
VFCRLSHQPRTSGFKKAVLQVVMSNFPATERVTSNAGLANFSSSHSFDLVLPRSSKKYEDRTWNMT